MLVRQRAESMAQKVQVLLVDDLDGSKATETVAFGLDGASYEIDLSTRNASKLRQTQCTFPFAAVCSSLISGRAIPLDSRPHIRVSTRLFHQRPRTSRRPP
jgi:hypothetical protein